MQTTANYALKKPEDSDTVKIEDLNDNADTIDAELKKRALITQIPTAPVQSVNGKTGAVTLSSNDIKAADGSTLEAVKEDFDSHKADKTNPHNVTASQVGLGNVTNDAQVKRSEIGATNGVAQLIDGKVPSSQLPAGVQIAQGTFADTTTNIGTNQTYTKSIPLGFNAKRGRLVILGGNSVNNGALIFFNTISTNTVSIIGNYIYTGSSSYLVDNNWLGSYIELVAVYISGSNLILQFKSSGGSGTLNVPYCSWGAEG